MLQPLVQLLTRLVVGWVFLRAGLGKLGDLDQTVKNFEAMGIIAPELNGPFIATVETVGGACVMLGLCTRFFGALLSATMIVAMLTAHRQQIVEAFSGGKQELYDVLPVTLLLFLGWIVAFGAGPISLDRILFQKYARTTTDPGA